MIRPFKCQDTEQLANDERTGAFSTGVQKVGRRKLALLCFRWVEGDAYDVEIPANRITGIVNEQRAITAETAVLLGHYFNTSAEVWMSLQARYDLRIAQRAAAAQLRKLPRRDTAAA